MNDIKMLKKFASAVIENADTACALADRAINVRKMQKEASAKKIEFDAAKLQKAASAVASLYGDRAAVNADSLQRVWNANPNAVVDSLVKVASDSVEAKVREPGMVTVKKQASSVKAKSEMPRKANSAHSAFDLAFGL